MFKRKHYGLPGILVVDFVQLRKRSVRSARLSYFRGCFSLTWGRKDFFLQSGSRFWLIMLVRNPSR